MHKIISLSVLFFLFSIINGQNNNIKTYIKQGKINEIEKFIINNGLNGFLINSNENNVNKHYSILGYATMINNSNIVDFLLGIDSINIEKGYIDDFYEYNCALISVEINSITTLKKLVAHGAIINQSFGEYGFSCIYSAVESNNIDLCSYLLSNKVNPNPILDIYEEAYYFIPLIKAVENKNINMIKLLFDNGADASICDNEGVCAKYLITNNAKLLSYFKDYIEK